MILKVNPTRIELIHLRDKLKIVEQGYTLLKKKRDGLMKEFLRVIKELKELREKLNEEIVLNFRYFIFARAFLRNKEIEEIFSTPSKKIRLGVEKKNIMGVEVPVFNLKEEGDFLNYSLISTNVNLDLGLLGIAELLKDLIKLAEIQKTAFFLSYEIEKTRRRVNALEYVHLPNLKATIKHISTKLEERERFENIILMKTKELIA
jgi:V/A-type H+-transporting ATPase subunit D